MYLDKNLTTKIIQHLNTQPYTITMSGLPVSGRKRIKFILIGSFVQWTKLVSLRARRLECARYTFRVQA